MSLKLQVIDLESPLNSKKLCNKKTKWNLAQHDCVGQGYKRKRGKKFFFGQVDDKS